MLTRYILSLGTSTTNRPRRNLHAPKERSECLYACVMGRELEKEVVVRALTSTWWHGQKCLGGLIMKKNPAINNCAVEVRKSLYSRTQPRSRHRC